MNKARLTRVVKLLREHRDNGVRFDLGLWYETNVVEENWCGTAACAVGLCMMDKTFQKQGLGMSISVWINTRKNPKYKGLTNFTAVARFFGISFSHAEWLFSTAGYDSRPMKGDKAAREVATRVAAYIKRGGTLPKRMKNRV